MSFIFSSSSKVNEHQSSEFWNRDDEASCSEEDISDSDGILFSQDIIISFGR